MVQLETILSILVPVTQLKPKLFQTVNSKNIIQIIDEYFSLKKETGQLSKKLYILCREKIRYLVNIISIM